MDVAALTEKGARYVAEFVGTFTLVFTVGVTVSTHSDWAVVAIASVLMVMIYALGPVSGANFNPAVSLSLGICKKLEWSVVFGYCTVQLLGGLCAGTAFSYVVGESIVVDTGKGFQELNAFGAEMGYTAMLCFVVLNVACTSSKTPNEYFGLAIGWVILAGGYAVGGISGANFNPAVTLGLVASSLGKGLFHGVFWMMAQLLGAAFAAVMYFLVRPEEFARTQHPLVTKAIAEFYGTLMLALTVCLNIVTGSNATALSAGACLMCMIYALGDVSGGHFNPAVSIGVLARGGNKIDATQCGVYILVQLLAGLVAGFKVSYLTVLSEGTKTLALAPGEHGLKGAVVAEIMFTFVLVFVVLSVATVQNMTSSYSFGLAIGSCVVAGGFAAGAISGGALNPAVAAAVAAGPLMSDHDFAAVNFLIWTGAEIAGALLAAGMFFLTWRSEYKTADYIAMAPSGEA
eukprot:TRINITY_DN8049_c0_g1_i1.p1 TRINITY_DN8049_c0_g1~~TRINITY_DN8049_c0_g1_i1.p1  ORF type:complete len:459 (-),score=89.31 TRINITY_DN8049_c0_g1_i1:360-1736(-)